MVLATKKNFFLHFGCYDLTNDMTCITKIWYNASTCRYVQDHIVENIGKGLKNHSYLNLEEGIIFWEFWALKTNKHKDLKALKSFW